MKTRRLRPFADVDPEFAGLKQRLLELRVGCPLCAAWDNPHENVSQACVVCGDTGNIPGWHALPLWEEQLIPDAPFFPDDEDLVDALMMRLTKIVVKCAYCHGARVGVDDKPCPVCYRDGTANAWASATLAMVRCPHCDGYGMGGSPGAGWSCAVCRTSGEVPLLSAVQYSPDSWWETFSPFASFEDCLAESDRERCFEDFDMRLEARPGRWWTDFDFRDVADLRGLDLRDSDFENSKFDDLGGSNLSGSNLEGAHIRDAARAKFTRCSMRTAILRGGSFQGANFRGADLREANLRLGDFTGAVFDGANLEFADLAGATLTSSTISRANGLKGANLFEVEGLTPRQRVVCLRKGAVAVSPDDSKWRHDDYWNDEHVDEDDVDLDEE